MGLPLAQFSHIWGSACPGCLRQPQRDEEGNRTNQRVSQENIDIIKIPKSNSHDMLVGFCIVSQAELVFNTTPQRIHLW